MTIVITVTKSSQRRHKTVTSFMTITWLLRIILLSIILCLCHVLAPFKCLTVIFSYCVFSACKLPVTRYGILIFFAQRYGSWLRITAQYDSRARYCTETAVIPRRGGPASTISQALVTLRCTLKGLVASCVRVGSKPRVHNCLRWL